MCQPYIESATALSDYDEESQKFPVLSGCGKELPALSWTHNVSIDLKYDVCACKCLCTAYPLESGEVTA